MIHYGELPRGAKGGFAADVHIKEARVEGGGDGAGRGDCTAEETKLCCFYGMLR